MRLLPHHLRITPNKQDKVDEDCRTIELFDTNKPRLFDLCADSFGPD
jgi:hypothetical protein